MIYNMNPTVTSFAKTFLAVFFIALTAVSCSEDNSASTLINDDLGDVHLKYTYNNVEYGVINPLTYNLTNKKIDAINGSGSNLKRITLYMPLNPTVGTHFITADPSDDSTYGAYFVSQANNVDILADTGIMTITNVTDDYVKGTFNFSGPNGPGGSVIVSVTSGSFLAER